MTRDQSDTPAPSRTAPRPDSADTTWIDDQVGYLLRRASATMAADFATRAASPLRPVQISLLSVIDATPGIGQGALGATLGIQRTNTAPLVATLVDLGLVDRAPSPIDGRRVELHLTDLGRRALAAGRVAIEEHEARILSDLDETDRDTLRSLLRRLVR